MIDIKRTLENLHKEFPEFDLDTLFKIIDLIKETASSNLSYPAGIKFPTGPTEIKPLRTNGINEMNYTIT